VFHQPLADYTKDVRTALIRLLDAVLAEQHDEWTEQRRYLGLDLVVKADSPRSSPRIPSRKT
jgi:putative transposase